MDKPTEEAKNAAWQFYCQRFGLDPDQEKPDAADWTIAEVKKCCVEAGRLNEPLTSSAQRVVPVTATAGDRIRAMRNWATDRALSADQGGIYKRQEADQTTQSQRSAGPSTGRRKRRVNR
jgi:hypothetical protein